jgi:hypothetical protein
LLAENAIGLQMYGSPSQANEAMPHLKTRDGNLKPGEARRLIETYLRAKDENRPQLMADAFEPQAVVEMTVATPAISFPGRLDGLERITDVLVRDFGQVYENVYSFCLQAPEPDVASGRFRCDWLVTMSEKSSRKLRIGCGHYDWHFACTDRWRIRRLQITIAAMEVLDDGHRTALWGWTWALERPWARKDAALELLPRDPRLESVRKAMAEGRR